MPVRNVCAWRLPARRALLAWLAACMLMLMASPGANAQEDSEPAPRPRRLPEIFFWVYADTVFEGSSPNRLRIVARTYHWHRVREDLPITVRIGNESRGPGFAMAGADYMLALPGEEPTPGPITINMTIPRREKASEEKVFTVEILDDEELEGDETIVIQPVNPVGYTLREQSDNITIIDNDVVSVSVLGAHRTYTSSYTNTGYYQLDEGDDLVIRFTRGIDVEGVIVVHWDIVRQYGNHPGHATQDDYTVTEGGPPRLRIRADEDYGEIRIHIEEDDLLEGRQTFEILLNRIVVGRNTTYPKSHELGIFQIIDAERLTLSISDPPRPVPEGGAVEFTVNAKREDGITQVRYAYFFWRVGDGGDATDGEDFDTSVQSDYDDGKVSGRIYPDETEHTIRIPVIADGFSEPEETFGVVLLPTPSPYARFAAGIHAEILFESDSATATIAASDPLVLELPEGTVQVDEGEPARFPITISGGLRGEEITVEFSVTPETATPGTDYTQPAAERLLVTIPVSTQEEIDAYDPERPVSYEHPGLSVMTLDDDDLEGTETFSVSVRIVDAGSMPITLQADRSTAIGEIIDDEEAPTGIALSIVTPTSASIAENATAPIPVTVRATFTGPGSNTLSEDETITLAFETLAFPRSESPLPSDITGVGADVTAYEADGTTCSETPRNLETDPVTITIEDGDSSDDVSFCLAPDNDLRFEHDREWRIDAAQSYKDGTGAYPVEPAILTIEEDDDPPDRVEYSLMHDPVLEGGGPIAVTVTARLMGGGGSTYSERVEIPFLVSDGLGTATLDDDYTVDYGGAELLTIFIDPGEREGSGVFTISPIADNFTEGDETVTGGIQAISHSSTSYPSHQVAGALTELTIVDDDVAPTGIRYVMRQGGHIGWDDTREVGEGAGPTNVEIGAELLCGPSPGVACGEGDPTFDFDITLPVRDYSRPASWGSPAEASDYSDDSDELSIIIREGSHRGQSSMVFTPIEDTIVENWVESVEYAAYDGADLHFDASGARVETAAEAVFTLGQEDASVLIVDDDNHIALVVTPGPVNEGERVSMTLTAEFPRGAVLELDDDVTIDIQARGTLNNPARITDFYAPNPHDPDPSDGVDELRDWVFHAGPGCGGHTPIQTPDDVNLVYTLPTLTIEASSGNHSGSLTDLCFEALDDNLHEGNEVLTFSAFAFFADSSSRVENIDTSGDFRVTPTTLSITDTDTLPGPIALSVDSPASAEVSEDDGPTSITLTARLPEDDAVLSEDLELTVTLEQGDAPGEARAGSDYQAVPPLDITIPAGHRGASTTFTLTPVDDSAVESDETIRITGDVETAAYSGIDVTGTGLTLSDDDDAPTGIRYRADGQERVRFTEGDAQTDITVTAELMCGTEVCGADSAFNFALALPVQGYRPPVGFGVPAAEASDYRDSHPEFITIAEGGRSGQFFVAFTPTWNVTQTAESDEAVAYAAYDGDPVRLAADGSVIAADDATTDVAFTLTQQPLHVIIEDVEPEIALELSRREMEEGYEEVAGVLGANITLTASFPEGITFDMDDDVTIRIEARSPRNPLQDSDGLGYALAPPDGLRDWNLGCLDVNQSLTAGDQLSEITTPLTIDTSDGARSGTLDFCFEALDDSLHEDEETVTFSAFFISGSTRVADKDTSDRFTVAPDDLTITDTDTLPGPIALSVDSPASAEVSEDDGPTSITLTARLPEDDAVLSEDLELTVTLEQGDAPGEARAGSDYQAVPPLDITIPAGHRGASTTFTLTPVDDSTVESDETIPITGEVRTAAYSGIDVTGTELTLMDDDDAPTGIRYRVDGNDRVSVTEGDAQTDITVTAELMCGTEVCGPDSAFNFALALPVQGYRPPVGFGVPAAEASDYRDSHPESITIAEGGLSEQFSVAFTPVWNVTQTAENDEAVAYAAYDGGRVRLAADGSVITATDTTTEVAFTLAQQPAYIIIEDVEPEIALELNRGKIAEGYEEVAGVLGANITLTASFPEGITFDMDDDVTIRIEVRSPRNPLQDSDGLGYALAPPDGLRDWNLGCLDVSQSLTAGDQLSEITTPLSIDTSDGARSGTLGFCFEALDDSLHEDEETVIFSAFFVSGSTRVADKDTSDRFAVTPDTLTITDTDTLPGPIALAVDSPASAEVSEDDGATSITLTARLPEDGAALSEDLTVTVTLEQGEAPGEARAGSDYRAVPPQTITIPAGHRGASTTFTLTPTNDSAVEPDETIPITGDVQTAAYSGIDVTGTELTLMDDDDAPTGIRYRADGQERVSVTEGDAQTDITVTVELMCGTEVCGPDSAFNFALALPVQGYRPPVGFGVPAAEASDYRDSHPESITIAEGGLSEQFSVAFTPVWNVTQTAENDEAVAYAAYDGGRVRLAADGSVITATDTTTEVAFTLTQQPLHVIIEDVEPEIALELSRREMEEGYEEVAGVLGANITLTASFPEGITFDMDDDVTIRIEARSPRNPLQDSDGLGYALAPPDGLRDWNLGCLDVNQSLTAGDQLSEITTPLTIDTSDGARSGTLGFCFEALDDSLHEDEETVTFSAFFVSGSTRVADKDTSDRFAVTPDDLTITDTDTLPGPIALSVDAPDSAGVSEGDGATSITLTARLPDDGAALSEDLTVTVTLEQGEAPGEARAGSDYQAVSPLDITIPAGHRGASTTFTLTPVDDSTVESDETIPITGEVRTAAYSGIDVTGTELTLMDDDDAPTGIRYRVDGNDRVSVTEGDAQTDITVTAELMCGTEVCGADSAFNFALALPVQGYNPPSGFGVPAAEASDYRDSHPESITIAEGGLSEQFSVAFTPVWNVTQTAENDEAVAYAAYDGGRVRLAADGSVITATDTTTEVAFTLAQQPAYIIIEDVEPEIALELNRGKIAEGYEEVAGILGADITLTASFPEGITFDMDDDVTIRIEARSPRNPLQDSDGLGYALAPPDGLRDWNLGCLDVNQSLTAGDQLSEITTPLTIDTSDGARSGTLGFCFEALDDSLHEDEETVTFSAFFVSGSTRVADKDTSDRFAVTPDDLTITDTDTLPGPIVLSVDAPDPAEVREGDGATSITLTARLPEDGAALSDDLELTVTLEQGAAPGEARAGSDYQAVSPQTITIPAGHRSASTTFTLTPTNDSIVEPDETIPITGDVETAAYSGIDVTGTELTLSDDDDAPTGIRYRVDGQERVSVTEGDAQTDITVTAELMCGTEVCGAASTFLFALALPVRGYRPPVGFGVPAAETSDYRDSHPEFITIAEGGRSGQFFVAFTPVWNVTQTAENDEAVAYAAYDGGQVRLAADGSVIAADDATTDVAFTLAQQPAYIIIEDVEPEIALALNHPTIEEGYTEHGRLGDNMTLTASFPEGITFDMDDDVVIKVQARSPRNPLPGSGGLDYALDASIRGRDWWLCGVDMVNADGGADQVTGITNPMTIRTSAGRRSFDLTFCFQALDDLLYEGPETVTFSAYSGSEINSVDDRDMSGRFTVTPETLTITDTDTPPAGPIALSVHAPDPAIVSEGDTAGVPARIEARFPAGSTVLSEDLTVTVAMRQGVAPGEARFRGAGDGRIPDYEPVSPQTITIPAGHRGARSPEFTLTPLPDNTVEEDETIPIIGDVETPAYTGIDVTPTSIALLDDDNPGHVILTVVPPTRIPEDTEGGEEQTTTVTVTVSHPGSAHRLYSQDLRVFPEVLNASGELLGPSSEDPRVSIFAGDGRWRLSDLGAGTPFTFTVAITPRADNIAEENVPLTINARVCIIFSCLPGGAGYMTADLTVRPETVTIVDNDAPPTIIALRLTEVRERAPLVTGRMGPRLSFDEAPGAVAEGANAYLLSAHFVDGGVLNRDVTLNNIRWFDPSIVGSSGAIDPLVIRKGARDSNFAHSPVSRGSNNNYAGDWVVTFRLPDDASPPEGFTAVQPAYLRYTDNDTEIRLTTVDPAGVSVPEGAGVAPVTVRADIRGATGTKSFLTTSIVVPIEFRPYSFRPALSPADYIVTRPRADNSCPERAEETATASGLVVRIEPGRTDGQATFCFRPVADDDGGEGTEFVNITYRRSGGTPVGWVDEAAMDGVHYSVHDSSNSARIRILEPVLATVHRTPEGALLMEGVDDHAEFTVRLSRAADFPVEVSWSVSDEGGVTEGEDYEAPASTMLTFAPGERSKNLRIDLLDDKLLEGSERLVVTLDGISGGPGGSVRVGDPPGNSDRHTILDNDVPNVRVGSVELAEGSGPAQVRLDLVYPTPGVVRSKDVWVQFLTSPGTATPVEDYIAVSLGRVDFPVNMDRGFAVVGLVDDDIPEAERETLRVVLTTSSPLVDNSPPDGEGRGQGVITIIDDDYARPGITLDVGLASVEEDVAPRVQPVSISARFTDSAAPLLPLPVVITLELRDITTTLGEDYHYDASALPTLTIPAGAPTSPEATFEITIEDDPLIEGDETLEVRGSAEDDHTVAPHTLRIVDNERDHDSIVLSTEPPELVEGAGATHVKLIATLRGGEGVLAHDVEIPLERFDIHWTPGGERRSPLPSRSITLPAGQGVVGTGDDEPIYSLARDDHFRSDRGIVIGAASTYAYAGRYPIEDLILRVTDASAPPGGITLSVEPGEPITEDAGAVPLTLLAEFDSPSLFFYDVVFPVEFSPEVVVTQRVGGVCTNEPRDLEADPVIVTIPENVENPVGRSDPFCVRAPGDNVVETNRTLTISADPVPAQPGLDISAYPVSPAVLTITEDDLLPDAVTLSLAPPGPISEAAGLTEVMLRAAFNSPEGAPGGDGPGALTVPTDFPVVFPNHEAVKVKVTRKPGGGACPSTPPESPASSVTVTIEARRLEGAAPLCVWPEDDQVAEGDRTLEIDIVEPSVLLGYTVTPTSLAITEDDTRPTRIVLDVQPGELVEGRLGPHTAEGISGHNEFTLTAGFETGSGLLAAPLRIPLDTAFSYWTPAGVVDVLVDDIAEAPPVSTVTIPAETSSGNVNFHMKLDENGTFLPEAEHRIVAEPGFGYDVEPAILRAIYNNPPPTGVTLSLDIPSVAEDAGLAEVMLAATLEGSSTLPYEMEIPVSFSDLAAAGIEALGRRVGDSCVASPLTITIPTNESSSSAAPICVKPRQDRLVTPNRTLTISAPDQPAPPGFSPYRVASATLTITEGGTPPTGVAFRITPDTVDESAVDETITVTATLTGGSGAFPDTVTPVAVVYPVTTEGVDDYTVRTSGASAGLVPIAISAGERTGSAAFTISPTLDNIVEENETVGVGFPDGRTGEITSSGVRYTLTGTSGFLTIVDDDTRPSEIFISLDPGEVDEGRLTPVRVTAAFQGGGDSRLPEDVTVSLEFGGDTRDYAAFAADREAACGASSGPAPAPGPGRARFSVVIEGGTRRGERYLCFTPVSDGVFAGERRVPVSLYDPEGELADYTVTVQPESLVIRDEDTAPSRVLLQLSRTEIPEEGGEQALTLTAQFPDGDGAAPGVDTVVFVPLTSSGGDDDYGGYQVNPGSVTLTIPAGSRVSDPAPFSLTPADDDVVEFETIHLGGGRATASLGWPAGDSAAGPGRPDTLPVDGAGAELRITDDDVSLVSLEGPPAPVAEGEPAVFTVRLSAPVAGPVTVEWSTLDGSAVASEADYIDVRAGSVELSASPPGLAVGSLSVLTHTDELPENEEYFEVSLGAITSAYGGRVRVDDTGTARAIIAANGTITVLLEGPPQGVPEGEDAVFRVSLLPEGILPDAPITLSYATQDGTAEAGRDYSGKSGTLQFTRADAAPQEVHVSTLDNILYNGERSFTLRLDNVTGGGDRPVQVQAPLTGEDSRGFAAPARIVDDETPPELHLLALPGELREEDAGTPRGIARLGVELRGSAFAEARTVDFTFGGDATLGEDYRVSGDSITIPAGALGRIPETIQIDVINDEENDDDEWILVSARVPEEAITVLGDARQVLIRDDDDPWVTVSFAEAFVEIPESRSRRITALLDAPPERQVVIPLAVERVGGAGREDYADVPDELVFGPETREQHFTLRVLRDRVEDEAGEGIRVSIVEAALPERVLLGEPASIAVSFVELPFGEDVQHALKYALASFGRSVAMSTLDVIEDRFKVTEDTLGASYIAVGGRRVPLGAVRRGPRERSAKRSSKPTLRDVTDVLGVRFPRRSDGAGSSLSAPGSIDGGYGSGLGPFASFAPGSWSGGGGASSSASGNWSGGGGYGGGTNFAGASSASASARNTGSRNIGRGGGEPDMRVRIEPPGSRDLLSRSEFRLAPGAAGTVAVDSAWTVWGRSDVRSFDGNPGGRFELDATTYSTHLGVDYRRSESLLTGFSLSHTVGDMSYVDASRDDTRGDFRAHLTALNHYSHWSYSDTLDLYVVMGEGFGVAEIKEYGKRAKTDINLHSSVLGARHALPPAGVVAMAAKADAFLVEVESDARPAIGLPKLKTQVMRMRAMLEGSVQSTLMRGARLRNTFEMGVLLDAGDADRGEGLELGTDFHYADDISGVELSGRWMLAYASGGYQEWGAAITLNLDPGAPGRGVRLSLAPDWGAPASGGVDALWRGASTRDAAYLQAGGADPGDRGPGSEFGHGPGGGREHGYGRAGGRRSRGASPEQVKMELAYGMGLLQGGFGGRVEPFGTWFFEDSGAWNLRLGVRLELSRFARSETGESSWLPNSLQMEFFNERHTFLYREDDHRIGIKLSAGF